MQLHGEISNSLDSYSVNKQILHEFYYRIGLIKDFFNKFKGDQEEKGSMILNLNSYFLWKYNMLKVQSNIKKQKYPYR